MERQHSLCHVDMMEGFSEATGNWGTTSSGGQEADTMEVEMKVCGIRREVTLYWAGNEQHCKISTKHKQEITFPWPVLMFGKFLSSLSLQ